MDWAVFVYQCVTMTERRKDGGGNTDSEEMAMGKSWVLFYSFISLYIFKYTKNDDTLEVCALLVLSIILYLIFGSTSEWKCKAERDRNCD